MCQEADNVCVNHEPIRTALSSAAIWCTSGFATTHERAETIQGSDIEGQATDVVQNV